MTPNDLLRIARQCQTQGRKLAAFQNTYRLGLLTPIRMLINLWSPVRPYYTPSEVTEAVNALLNSGNVLERLAKEAKQSGESSLK